MAAMPAAMLAGCASDERLKKISAPEVRCPAEEILIEESGGEEGRQTWFAICDGERFFCDEGEDGVMCAEEKERE
jgi:hypothetical protein